MPKKKDDIKETVKQVEKRQTENRIITNAGFEMVSYGSDIMDLISGSGAPWGKITNIVGDKSTGKTLLTSELIAQAYQIYGKDLVWDYDDVEAGYSFDSRSIWGIDIVDEDSQPSITIEDFALNLERKMSKLKKKQRLIYVVDSLDGTTTEAELKYREKKMKALAKRKDGTSNKEEKGTYGTDKAKGMSEFFRTTTKEIKNQKVLLIIISQVRENISTFAFAPRYHRTGGKALDFYSSHVFWLREVCKHELVTGRPSGVAVEIKNTKNKYGKPFRKGIIDILFDYGVDNISSNLKFLYDLRTAKEGKDKGKINEFDLDWNGEIYSYRKLMSHIERENLEQELTDKVRAKWQELEDKADATKGRKSKFER
jgi:RecA/RadA recombinase